MDEILIKYYKWLNEVIIKNHLNFEDRLIIYNSLRIFKRHKNVVFDSFLMETEKIIDNLKFIHLKKISKFHILLYCAINPKESPTSTFIKQWTEYLQEHPQEYISHKFPFFLFNEKAKKLNILPEFKNYPDFRNNIERYSSMINNASNCGIKNVDPSFFEKSDIHLLNAIMILSYKNEYNLLLGNLLFRSLVYLGEKSSLIIKSCLNYLVLQQNEHGYFSLNLKSNEITKMLTVSFDSILTISEYENEDFRINSFIKEYYFQRS